jgi:hypothetical protein
MCATLYIRAVHVCYLEAKIGEAVGEGLEFRCMDGLKLGLQVTENLAAHQREVRENLAGSTPCCSHIEPGSTPCCSHIEPGSTPSSVPPTGGFAHTLVDASQVLR